LRPVEAVQDWLAAASITSGPVFRAVLRGGRVQAEALKAHALPEVVKQRIMVQPHGVTDDLGREPVPRVGAGRGGRDLHAVSLARHKACAPGAVNLPMPNYAFRPSVGAMGNALQQEVRQLGQRGRGEAIIPGTVALGGRFLPAPLAEAKILGPFPQ
jgi:hypothetical protein